MVVIGAPRTAPQTEPAPLGIASAAYTWRLGRLAQLGERLPYKQEVAGSRPAPPITEHDSWRRIPKRSVAASDNILGRVVRVWSGSRLPTN